MFGKLIGEVFGTFILILLGDGVVANVGLAPRLAAPAYNWNTITFGWAFAVIVAVYVSAGVSGAHLNPAVTIATRFETRLPLERRFALHWRAGGGRISGRVRGLPGLHGRPGESRYAERLVHRTGFGLWTGLLGRNGRSRSGRI